MSKIITSLLSIILALDPAEGITYQKCSCVCFDDVAPEKRNEVKMNANMVTDTLSDANVVTDALSNAKVGFKIMWGEANDMFINLQGEANNMFINLQGDAKDELNDMWCDANDGFINLQGDAKDGLNEMWSDAKDELNDMWCDANDGFIANFHAYAPERYNTEEKIIARVYATFPYSNTLERYNNIDPILEIGNDEHSIYLKNQIEERHDIYYTEHSCWADNAHYFVANTTANDDTVNITILFPVTTARSGNITLTLEFPSESPFVNRLTLTIMPSQRIEFSYVFIALALALGEAFRHKFPYPELLYMAIFIFSEGMLLANEFLSEGTLLVNEFVSFFYG